VVARVVPFVLLVRFLEEGAGGGVADLEEAVQGVVDERSYFGP